MREKGVRLYQKNMSNLFQNELKKGENNKDDNNNKKEKLIIKIASKITLDNLEIFKVEK